MYVVCVVACDGSVRVEKCQDPLPTLVKAVAVMASAVAVEAVPEVVSSEVVSSEAASSHYASCPTRRRLPGRRRSLSRYPFATKFDPRPTVLHHTPRLPTCVAPPAPARQPPELWNVRLVWPAFSPPESRVFAS